MFEFKLLENEKIELISNNSLIKYQKEVEEVSIIITNQRLLILNYPKDLENFRVGKIIIPPIKKEIIFETTINNIKSLEDNSKFDKYILEDGTYLLIKDIETKKYISSLIEGEK